MERIYLLSGLNINTIRGLGVLLGKCAKNKLNQECVSGLEKGLLFCLEKSNFLGTFTTNTSGQLDVLWHDGDTLGVDGAQVGVLKQTNQVCLAGLLKSHDGGALETEIGLEILGDFTYQTLEGQLPDQKLCALLVSTDLTESHCTGSVPMGLLHSSSGWGTLTSCLGGQLLSWGLAPSRLTSGLLGTSHCELCNVCPDV